MKYFIFLALTICSHFSFADIYPADTFGMHKLCISNPWAGTNFKGDATSTYPCHYDYAIVHVPTLLQEINIPLNTNLTITNPNLLLQIPPINISSFTFLMGYFYATTLVFLLTVWGMGLLLKIVMGKRFF